MTYSHNKTLIWSLFYFNIFLVSEDSVTSPLESRPCQVSPTLMASPPWYFFNYFNFENCRSQQPVINIIGTNSTHSSNSNSSINIATVVVIIINVIIIVSLSLNGTSNKMHMDVIALSHYIFYHIHQPQFIISPFKMIIECLCSVII